eukprot:gnl/TRDRNA2_/TRDRNA2_198089_c0_seq1.p1 gnl/TRDRNA2_/TRDRNA2_198089_c0~~gnl/TRDRNA2_/TRDRNA2_198089_c0_seq1.p1  ORF type:complete len:271 (-),score=64.62 gnl/TRDRNA2_/TRDRNA2_198089_c0_seq1:66-878(-)
MTEADAPQRASVFLATLCIVRALFHAWANTEDYTDELPPLSSDKIRAMHALIDKNGDGTASLSEVLEHSNQVRLEIGTERVRFVLKKLDTDKDGRLTMEELLAKPKSKKCPSAGASHTPGQFKLFDRNEDGFLDADELPVIAYPGAVRGQTVSAIFTPMDIDGDGMLSPQEVLNGGAADEEDELNDFKELDTDGDGGVSLLELTVCQGSLPLCVDIDRIESALGRLFGMADQDNDMHITADELVKAVQQIVGRDVEVEDHLMDLSEHHEL